MKRRGWRVALTVATLGVALVVGLVAFNWATVCDSLEAWRFLSTRTTRTVIPVHELRGWARSLPDTPFGRIWIDPNDLFSILADYSGVPVILDVDAERTTEGESLPGADCWSFTDVDALRNLRGVGYRILEQRLPYRSYVVIGYPTPPFDSEFLLPDQRLR
jgi:hypothetical protein